MLSKGLIVNLNIGNPSRRPYFPNNLQDPTRLLMIICPTLQHLRLQPMRYYHTLFHVMNWNESAATQRFDFQDGTRVTCLTKIVSRWAVEMMSCKAMSRRVWRRNDARLFKLAELVAES